MWLVMRGAMNAQVTKVHTAYHVPASNTAAGLALFDNGPPSGPERGDRRRGAPVRGGHLPGDGRRQRHPGLLLRRRPVRPHRAAVEHGLQLHAEGAAWVDVGGESTRPVPAGCPRTSRPPGCSPSSPPWPTGACRSASTPPGPGRPRRPRPRRRRGQRRQRRPRRPRDGRGAGGVRRDLGAHPRARPQSRHGHPRALRRRRRRGAGRPARPGRPAGPPPAWTPGSWCWTPARLRQDRRPQLAAAERARRPGRHRAARPGRDVAQAVPRRVVRDGDRRPATDRDGATAVTTVLAAQAGAWVCGCTTSRARCRRCGCSTPRRPHGSPRAGRYVTCPRPATTAAHPGPVMRAICRGRGRPSVEPARWTPGVTPREGPDDHRVPGRRARPRRQPGRPAPPLRGPRDDLPGRAGVHQLALRAAGLGGDLRAAGPVAPHDRPVPVRPRARWRCCAASR